ncbi:Crp/Fnr family transcriptional regulator [Pseudochryseolinea flava]|uniref:Crp/Fnr family transcriptional regulator n=1 Tax=Pseudochryseolinea flava TaxID=2059302 RepID=A0A364XYM7_9BACT|nr:Crp/Fnr family transcriptional regulator [Pseudochryseolinea flava]RAV98526.1 hypothetical protein DQQ10_23705 [Pseudochryseolinea flava]
MEKLKQALGFGGILSQDDIDYIVSHFKVVNVKASAHFHLIDVVANEIAFVCKGIFRVYALDPEGTDVTKYFVRENQFMVDLESYYAATPSKDAFQAVVGSEIGIIHKAALNKLTEEIPNMYIFLKSITEAHLLNKIKDNDFLNFGDAKTKYLEFTRRYATLAQQVPQQYIASYLKITPQSLSRIRNELTKQKC